MKKFLILTLMLSILNPLCANAQTTNFIDVKPESWFYEAVTNMAKQGIVQGTGDGYFSPNDSLTGAEFITMITRAFYDGEVSKATDQVTDNDWSAPYIYVANQFNLLDNVSVSHKNITRTDVAQIIYNLLAKNNVTLPNQEELQKINILDISNLGDLEQERIKTVAILKIMTGYEDGSFQGQNALTRAEATTIMSRLLEHYPNRQAMQEEDSNNELKVSLSCSKASSIVGSRYNITYSVAANASGGSGKYKYKFETIENDKITETTNWNSENGISGQLTGNGTCIIRVTVKDDEGNISKSEINMLDSPVFSKH